MTETNKELLQAISIMMDERFGIFEQRIDTKMDQKLDNLEQRMDKKMDQKLDSLKQELLSEIRHSENLILDEVTRVHNILIAHQNDITKHVS